MPSVGMQLGRYRTGILWGSSDACLESSNYGGEQMNLNYEVFV